MGLFAAPRAKRQSASEGAKIWRLGHAGNAGPDLMTDERFAPAEGWHAGTADWHGDEDHVARTVSIGY
jgi:hypothetical protein